MILTTDQLESLKQIKKHPWYKVLELIEETASNNLWNLLLEADLTKEENLKIVKDNQLYIKARRDFLQNIEKHLKEIYTPSL